MDDRLLSLKEVAAALAVSRMTVWREIDARHLAVVRIRSRKFVRASEVERYLRVRTDRAA